jgi:hypothetical protein
MTSGFGGWDNRLLAAGDSERMGKSIWKLITELPFHSYRLSAARSRSHW